MLEVREKTFSLWVNDVELAKNNFNDKEIGGDNVHVAVDFDATDGDSITVFGWEEFPASTPEYKPAPVVTPAAGGKKTPEKKPAEKKPTPAKPTHKIGRAHV